MLGPCLNSCSRTWHRSLGSKALVCGRAKISFLLGRWKFKSLLCFFLSFLLFLPFLPFLSSSPSLPPFPSSLLPPFPSFLPFLPFLPFLSFRPFRHFFFFLPVCCVFIFLFLSVKRVRTCSFWLPKTAHGWDMWASCGRSGSSACCGSCGWPRWRQEAEGETRTRKH